MKPRALLLACVLPILPVWLVLIYLADQKYPIVSAKEYWDSRFDHNVEYLRSGGYVWFPPYGVPLNGFWPERTREGEIDAAFFPVWNSCVSNLIIHEPLEDTNVLANLRSLTGANFGTNRAAWIKWKSQNTVTKERARSLIPKPGRDLDLEDYFKFHIKNRYWFATCEALFFCFLWTLVVLLVKWRLLDKLKLFKWMYVTGVVAFIAFQPWLFGYGDGAFTDWQGPDAIAYSGGFLWRGYISYGNSIGYRTFVEMFGSPPLWAIQHLPANRLIDGPFSVYIFFCAFYTIVGFMLASAS